MSRPVTLYAGMAGDTDDGRFISSGLYRSRDGGAWEEVATTMLPAPEVRAILSDPADPASVMIGTQSGIFHSADYGATWQRLTAPSPELAVWTLFRHPSEPATIFAGYEPCALYRSADNGATWEKLQVVGSWPDITSGPEMPKRVTGIAVEPGKPDTIYISLEIGGLLKSADGGKSWVAMIDGVYVVEDSVDLHGVVVSPTRPKLATVTTRVGAFQSADGGRHWRKLPVPPLREKGSYCRAIVYAPDRPDTIYLGAGNDFDGDLGALFCSDDNGATWKAAILPGPLKSTIFAVA
ncbi:MAG: hypothetical protein JNL61_14715, partial [Rhizobiaceae bacterium]|nr:hypothetical protein [Rhizobiaceae bacterium]